jgi:PiT family inorganic phosphate transporter
LLFVLLVIAVIWLSYSNGANDNFKGVATLYGSGAASFKRALAWATVATASGSLVSVFAASSLLKAFSGKGIVPDALTQSPILLLAVGAAGALTILLATYLGMPTSTTHALTGALVGSALVSAGRVANPGALMTGFVQPLLLSPLLAIAGAVPLYLFFKSAKRVFGITSQTCVCLDNGSVQPIALPDGTAVIAASGKGIVVDETRNCIERYEGSMMGVSVQPVADALHYASGTAVCFSRAVNDTPKIAALLFASGVGGNAWKLLLVAAAMTVGGLLNSRRVAETMSKRITELSVGQGLSANLMTSAIVLFASRLGLPVSTTHVACGSIFGIGLVNGKPKWKTMAQILAAWALTLPLAGALGALLFWTLSNLAGR